jgi:ubiquitin-conjugating enzyme E2 variant
MTKALVIAAQLAGVLLLIDFLSGFFHWLEDSYGTETTPVLGKLIVIPNLIHHREPRDFVKSAFWRRNVVTACLCLGLSSAYALVFGTSWRVYLFFVLGAFCNEFHCWAHRSPAENGPFIATLHRLRIIQTPGHHAVHHTDPKNRAYCVFTNLMNPMLDRIEFWRRLEGVIAVVLRVRPRLDPSVDRSAPGISTALV